MPNSIKCSRPRPAAPLSSEQPSRPSRPAQSSPSKPQGWVATSAARARTAAAPVPTMLPEGALKIPLKLMVNGREISAQLTTEVKNRQSSAEYSSRGVKSGTAITVQDLSEVRVQIGDKKYPLTDGALNALLAQKGVSPDFPFSSRTEISSDGVLGVGGSGKLVGLTADGGFELRKSDGEHFHSGVIGLSHPDRVY